MKIRFKALITLVVVLTLVTSMFLAGCAKTPEQSAPSGTDYQQEETAAAALGAADMIQKSEISYVSIDINPSIELKLVDGFVAEAKAYNDDGQAIILSTDVSGMTPEEAVAALIGSFASEGYITAGDENATVVITVAGGQGDGLAENLKQSASTILQDMGLECNVVTTSVAEEIVNTAENSGLSIGRYLLLKQIALQEDITLDEAKEKYGSLKMYELLALIDNIDEFLKDIDDINKALDTLTPEQLQMLTQARLAFQNAMRSAQRAFLEARTQARNAFHTARDEAKNAFLESKDNTALKAAKKQIKETFALAKKTATDTLRQAKIRAREEFMAAIEGFGLDRETIDKLLEWNFDTVFEVDMDFEFENADFGGGKDKQKESVKENSGKENSSGQGKGKGNGKNKS